MTRVSTKENCIRISPAFSAACIIDINKTIENSGMFSSKSDFLLSALRSFQYRVSHELNNYAKELAIKGMDSDEISNMVNQRYDSLLASIEMNYWEDYAGPSKIQITAYLPRKLFDEERDADFIKNEVEKCSKAAIVYFLRLTQYENNQVNMFWMNRTPISQDIINKLKEDLLKIEEENRCFNRLWKKGND